MDAAAGVSGALPNLLIVGVAKAATTSLFRYLSQHPEIFPADLKELRYFTPLRYDEPLAPIGDYLAHFEGRTTQRYALEATPGYFPGGRAVAAGIDGTLPGARVILSLRDPSDRCWSYFRFVKSRVRIPPDMSFETYLDRCEELHRRGTDDQREHQPFWGLGAGCYSTWLPSWTEVFGDRLRVVFFDDVMTEPRTAVTGICRWLDLDTDAVGSFEFATDNKSEQYRHKRLQLAALALNRRAERFFTRHRTVKRSLVRVYHRSNSQPAPDRPSPQTWARLAQFYQPHTAALARQLTDLGVRGHPGWLSSG